MKEEIFMSNKESAPPPRYDEAYREILAKYGITQSMSRKGDLYDNAVAENSFCCLKCELVYHRRYASRAQATADVFAYIETFYNTVRPHSWIGRLTPNMFERLCREKAAA